LERSAEAERVRTTTAFLLKREAMSAAVFLRLMEKADRLERKTDGLCLRAVGDARQSLHKRRSALWASRMRLE